MLVCVVSYVKPLKSAIANVSLIFHMSLFGVLPCVIYLWEYEFSVETYSLEVAFITISSTPHVLVALWAGYNFTKHIQTRLRCKFRGPRCKVALRYMANGVRLCLRCKSHTGYQEMLPQWRTHPFALAYKPVNSNTLFYYLYLWLVYYKYTFHACNFCVFLLFANERSYSQFSLYLYISCTSSVT